MQVGEEVFEGADEDEPVMDLFRTQKCKHAPYRVHFLDYFHFRYVHILFAKSFLHCCIRAGSVQLRKRISISYVIRYIISLKHCSDV